MDIEALELTLEGVEGSELGTGVLCRGVSSLKRLREAAVCEMIHTLFQFDLIVHKKPSFPARNPRWQFPSGAVSEPLPFFKVHAAGRLVWLSYSQLLKSAAGELYRLSRFMRICIIYIHITTIYT